MSSNKESLKTNQELFPELEFKPHDRGWYAMFPDRNILILGNKLVFDFQTKETPEDFPYIPAIKKEYVHLFELIISNIDQIISTVENKINEVIGDCVSIKLLTDSVIWINDDYYDFETWTFVIKSKDEAHLFMIQFNNLDLIDAW